MSCSESIAEQQRDQLLATLKAIHTECSKGYDVDPVWLARIAVEAITKATEVSA